MMKNTYLHPEEIYGKVAVINAQQQCADALRMCADAALMHDKTHVLFVYGCNGFSQNGSFAGLLNFNTINTVPVDAIKIDAVDGLPEDDTALVVACVDTWTPETRLDFTFTDNAPVDGIDAMLTFTSSALLGTSSELVVEVVGKAVNMITTN